MNTKKVRVDAIMLSSIIELGAIAVFKATNTYDETTELSSAKNPIIKEIATTLALKVLVDLGDES